MTCGSCEGTGSFTHLITTKLTGSVKRTWLFGKTVPDEVKESLRTLGVMAFAGAHAQVRLCQLSPEQGGLTAEYLADFPHVHADLRVRQLSIVIDALGSQGIVPNMPKFLDVLLGDAASSIRSRSASPARKIESAKSTRLTGEVLSALGSKAALDPQEISSRFLGAVSDTLVQDLHRALAKAYDGVGRSGVRQAWLVGGAFTIMAVVLERLYRRDIQLPEFIADYAGWYAYAWEDWLHTLMPWSPALLFVMTCLYAPLWGRRKIRHHLGSAAMRKPPRGRLPFVTAAMAFLTFWTVTRIPVDSANFGLPGRTEPLFGNVESLGDLGRWAITEIPEDWAAALNTKANAMGIQLPERVPYIFLFDERPYKQRDYAAIMKKMKESQGKPQKKHRGS